MPNEILLEPQYQIAFGTGSTAAIRRNVGDLSGVLHGSITTGTFASYINVIPMSQLAEVDETLEIQDWSKYNNTALRATYKAPKVTRSISKERRIKLHFWQKLKVGFRRGSVIEQITVQVTNPPYHVVGIYDDMGAVSLTIGVGDISVAVDLKSNLFADLLKLQQSNKLDNALDLQFRTIESWIMHGKMSVCEAFLTDSRLDSLNTELLTALLVVTKPWKNIIKARPSFSMKVQELLSKRDATQAAKKLVQRLI